MENCCICGNRIASSAGCNCDLQQTKITELEQRLERCKPVVKLSTKVVVPAKLGTMAQQVEKEMGWE